MAVLLRRIGRVVHTDNPLATGGTPLGDAPILGSEPYFDRTPTLTCRADRGGCAPVGSVLFCESAVRGEMDIAGWSSLVARRAHNPKVVGSNPAPATKSYRRSAS